jgi:hypothetical protein
LGDFVLANRSAAAVFFLVFVQAAVWSQTAVPDPPSPPTRDQPGQASQSTEKPAQPDADPQPKPETAGTDLPSAPSSVDQKTDSSKRTQSKRIFWIVPNYAAVSAQTELPRLSAHDKFVLAMHDSVDYSSFIWAGVLAGQSMALRSYPELHNGAAGYARYYWRAFADQASGAFFTEAIVPAMTHEDPRYYTLGRGNFIRRTAYALSQIVLTKTDSGGTSFNASEILGNGMEAGLSNLYYPPQERGFRKTAENWGTGIESAALNNIIKEFWPDIRHNILRQK